MSKHTISKKPDSADLITFEDLLDSVMSWRKDHIGTASEIEVSPTLYRKLNKIVHPESKILDVVSFYGLKVKIDPALNPGEWKLKS